MLLYLSQLLPLLGVLFTISCGAEEYYVTPTPPPNPGCSQFAAGKPCYTLDHYANNASYYFNGRSDISLMFLDGMHNSSKQLYVQGVENLVLSSLDHVNPQVTIRNLNLSLSECRGAYRIENLNIDGGFLKVYGQTNIQMLITQTLVHRCTVEIDQPSNVGEIVIQDVSMFDSDILVTGHGPECTMQLARSVLTNCTLTTDVAYQGYLNMNIKDCILFTHPDSVYIHKGRINGELILDNTTIVGLQTTPDSRGGLSSNRKCGSNLLCDVCIDASFFFGGTINITNSKLSRNFGTAICIVFYGADSIDVYIVNTTISNHKQGALFIDVYEPDFVPRVNVIIENSNIQNNSFSDASSSVTSAGITVKVGTSDYPIISTDVQIAIVNTLFSNNHNLIGQPSAIQLFHVKNLTIVDCEFRDNKGTAIEVQYSELTLSGVVRFMDNVANKGGALSLTSSHMNIARNTSIVFENNSATDVGGAMYIKQCTDLYAENEASTDLQCFYGMLNSNESGDNSISFINNMAKNGGDHVYGTSFDSFCIVDQFEIDNEKTSVRSIEVQKYFHFEPNQTSSPTAVSSHTTRVCVCDTSGQYNCTNITEIFFNTTAIPGEEFNLSVVVVGSEFGTGTGSVYAQFLPLHSPSTVQLEDHQYSQGIRNNRNCTPLNFTVYSPNTAEVIVLTAVPGTVEVYGDRESIVDYINDYHDTEVIPPGLLTTPVYVNVNLLPCPPGFNLTGDPPGCVCYRVFKQTLITCTISDGVGYVHRNGTLWVNASHHGNGTAGVIVHKYCPFGYCRPQLVSVDLNNPDTQCDFKRSGTLCGACRKGYSAALGTSKCLKCPNNNHLALLLFFALSGILLVLFIKVLNLTVTQGTINGLIFYANIVWANQSILYPHEINGASVFFKTFIAWLNLDFGIETCFIEGLDSYWKTWLQFVFPFYIWIIAGGIILASRYSTLMTRFFGNNSVHVLATLLLLSYSKLLRTIITALNVTFLVEYPSGQKSAVWSFDGNVPYCGIPHVFLFLAALAALLFLWLPYTSVLLFVQLLKRFSEFKLLRWIDKIKPFLDAYFAPLKDKHHYWVGVLLLVRGVLLMIFSLTSANIPTANLLAMVTTAGALVSYTSLTGHLYRKSYVSFLETASFLNLLLLGCGALYIKEAGGNRAALVFTSVGIAFMQFVATVLFHLWSLLKCHCDKNKAEKGYQYENIDEIARANVQEEPFSNDSAELREPLLEDTY